MIEFKNIYKSFDGNSILEDISFSVSKGETLFIVGPSGTGKSVSIKQLIGMIKPDKGEILVRGKDFFKLKRKEQYNYIKDFGVLFQSSALIAWMTIEENISLPLIENSHLAKKEIKNRVKKAIEIVQLKGAEQKYPSEISGGMQKRAGIARAIVHRPEIIIYDEPTSGLDPVISRHIDHLINDMKREFKITSLVVTHDLNSVLIAGDKVLMLHNKKILSFSDVDGFFKSDNPLIKDFIESQFPKTKGVKI